MALAPLHQPHEKCRGTCTGTFRGALSCRKGCRAGPADEASGQLRAADPCRAAPPDSRTAAVPPLNRPRGLDPKGRLLSVQEVTWLAMAPPAACSTRPAMVSGVLLGVSGCLRNCKLFLAVGRKMALKACRLCRMGLDPRLKLMQRRPSSRNGAPLPTSPCSSLNHLN